MSRMVYFKEEHSSAQDVIKLKFCNRSTPLWIVRRYKNYILVCIYPTLYKKKKKKKKVLLQACVLVLPSAHLYWLHNT